MSYAIIVAGGAGTRMGASRPKQYLMLNNRPVLAHTLQTFHKTGLFKAVVLVLPPINMAAHVCEITAYGKMGPMLYVSGGSCRQDSVFRGLRALRPFAEPDEVVCVHDGVRPLIDGTLIWHCLKAAQNYGAAIAGVPVTETVKRCNSNGQIEATIPRNNLWLAQTPQAALYQLLWLAHQNARQNNFNATDDAALLEAAGIPVHMVPGSRGNIKITLPEDLQFAAKFI